MKRILNVILSIIFGIILVILTNNKLGSTSLLGVLILLVLAWPLIWFGNHLGNLTAWWTLFNSSVTQVNKRSPAPLVTVMGWIFLLIYFFFIISYQV